MPSWSNADASANWTTDGATYMGFYVTLANGDFVLQPNGTGAFYLGPPADSTAVGGNPRGTNAVDLQLSRLQANKVADVEQAVIIGGNNNRASGFGSAIIGAEYGYTSGQNSFVGGGRSNNATSLRSAVVGGFASDASGSHSGVFVGYNGTASDTYAVVIGGENLIASGKQSLAAGGRDNNNAGQDSAIIAGRYHSIGATNYAGIIAGGAFASIAATGQAGAVIGGYYGYVSGVKAATIGGDHADAIGEWSVVVGGANGYATQAGAVTLGGIGAQADHPCSVAWSGNTWPTGSVTDDVRGKSQGQLVHLDGRIDNTGGAATTLNLASGKQSVGDVELAVPANAGLSIQGTVIMWNETDDTTVSWAVDCLVSNTGAAAVLVGGGGLQTIKHGNDAILPSATDCLLTISVSGTVVRFAATGITNKLTRWSAALFIARAATRV